MKQKKSLIVLLLSVILFSCEETITDVELPYVEQLVVSCVLENDDLVDSLRLERTLPPLEHYDEDKALVKDAKVQINDGDSTYDLFYSDGYYRTSNLIAQAGKTYKLNVEWKGKKATATTFVPNPVEIPKIEFEIRKTTGQWGEAYEVNVFSMIKLVKNVVYNSGVLNNSQGHGSYDFFNIYREIDVNSDGYCKVSFTNWYFYQPIDTNIIKEIFYDYSGVLSSYDAQFYQYFITRFNGQSGDEIFGGNSNNIQWNIKGDGIGLFIGRSTSYKKFF